MWWHRVGIVQLVRLFELVVRLLKQRFLVRDILELCIELWLEFRSQFIARFVVGIRLGIVWKYRLVERQFGERVLRERVFEQWRAGVREYLRDRRSL